MQNPFSFFRSEDQERIILNNFLDSLGQKTKFTPDVTLLERKQFHSLFIPDEMMKSHKEHFRLGECKYKGEAFTVDKLTLWRKYAGSAASALPLDMGFRDVPRLPIRGQWIYVPTHTIFDLDTHKANGVEYERKWVEIIVPHERLRYGTKGWYWDKETSFKTPLHAFMYIGVSSYWSPLLDGGFTFSPVRTFNPNNKLLSEYYHFTPKEYDGNSREPRTVLRLR